MSRIVTLSVLFNCQQELLYSKSVLLFKGKRVLAIILALALLPFLEILQLQFSFNYLIIQFFKLQQDRELPNITKPFLALEHVLTILARSIDTRDSSSALKHIVYPNASILALGILLYELYFYIPMELIVKDPYIARNVNSDFYTYLNKLQTLEDNTSVDYYLAIKACLTREYYPLRQHANFKDISVQWLFY